MEIQFGENPEITLSVCWNIHSWLGHIALPFTIEWFNTDAGTGHQFDIAFWFLGIRFGMEIWKWYNRESNED